MCRFQELYNSEGDYIVCCAECRHYQLLFNGVVLSMNQKEYSKFIEVVLQYKNDLLPANEKSEIPVPTPRQGVHLLLDSDKIAALYGMLEAADTEAKALWLL